jgi:hypothetical protein
LKNRNINLEDECYSSVLCQEILKGREYTVDQFSRDGIHKICMVWVHDKGPTNGANFIPFGIKPVDPTSNEAIALINYTRDVLDAISFDNGPSHAEIMMTPDRPCLLEMNCRTRGISGMWIPIAEALTGGYSQVDIIVDVFLDPVAFMNIPDKPIYPFKSSGQIVVLVSYSEGTIESIPAFDKIRNLPSFVALDAHFEVGDSVQKTTDLVTTLGIVTLCNAEAEMIERYVRFIRSMEPKKGGDEEDEELSPGLATVSTFVTEIGNNIPCRRRLCILLNTMLTNSYY